LAKEWKGKGVRVRRACFSLVHCFFAVNHNNGGLSAAQLQRLIVSGVVELFFFVSAQLKLRKTNGGAAVGWGRISHVDLLSISTSIAGRDVL